MSGAEFYGGKWVSEADPAATDVSTSAADAFVPPSFSDEARRLAWTTPFRRVTTFTPRNRIIVVNKVLRSMGFVPASDLLVMGSNVLLGRRGIKSKTVEGIQNGLYELDNSLKLLADPGPRYAAHLLDDVDQIPVQVVAPYAIGRGEDIGRRITIADAVQSSSLLNRICNIPDRVQELAEQYADIFYHTKETMT